MLVITTGAFGASTARLLGARVEVAHEPLATGEIPVVSGHAFVAAVLWRADDRLCNAIDGACWDARVPWLPLWLQDDDLVAGPMVRPGRGPCYACFVRRSRTHHQAPERLEALHTAWSRDAARGPTGYPPVTTWLAAALALEAAGADGREAPAGRLRLVNLLDGTLLDSLVVPVHGCPRCGAGAPRDGSRFVRCLVPVVKELLR